MHNGQARATQVIRGVLRIAVHERPCRPATAETWKGTGILCEGEDADDYARWSADLDLRRMHGMRVGAGTVAVSDILMAEKLHYTLRCRICTVKFKAGDACAGLPIRG